MPGFQSLTELLGGLLFPDAVPLKDRKATYTSASSYIVNLDSGPFNGRLALQNNRSQARLLDRELEVDLIVQELLKRSNDLKGQTASDKSFSPAFLVAQAPGAGKSHFLALLGEQIPILYDLDGKKETPIVSAFTYNSKMTVDIDNLKADLALRVLYGATRHMSRTTCEWRDFLKTWKSREIDSIDVDLAVEILRAWYGDRPVVILADELGKSKDEALVRQELCRTMDTWGGQVFVVMSSLTNYKAVVEMFERSQRRLYIFTLGVLGTQANDLLFQTLRQLPQNGRIRKGILEYRISLAWGATGGYAQAIELLSEYIRKQPGGLEAGVVGQATTHLSSCNVLPSRFSTKELETVLEMWEQEDCPFQTLNDITEKMPAATYKGSVLVDSLTKKGMQVRYLPTVAPWHAARLFTSKPPSFGRKKRCAKLMGLAGSAYLQKVQAIESPESNEAAMRQTSSYFTEVVAAFAVMFAIVKKYKKLPQVLRESESACDSICSIGFNVSLSQKKELATQSPADADEKLVSFLKKAMDLSKQLGKQESLLVIMAPPNCKAVDFLIFCQKNNRFVAAQVKSNKVTEATAQNAQKTALLKAAKDIRSASNSQPVAFLAIVGSNYTETEDLKADTDFFVCSKRISLPSSHPSCDNSRVWLQGCKAWKVRMRE